VYGARVLTADHAAERLAQPKKSAIFAKLRDQATKKRSVVLRPPRWCAFEIKGIDKKIYVQKIVR
jgi:hypothetical protein